MVKENEAWSKMHHVNIMCGDERWIKQTRHDPRVLPAVCWPACLPACGKHNLSLAQEILFPGPPDSATSPVIVLY